VRRALITAIALAATLATPAAAADLAVKAAPAAPAGSWTGFYVGLNGGYGWSDPTVTLTANDITTFTFTCGVGFGGTCPPAVAFTDKGGFGGVQAGYNWQLGTAWLAGLEADFDWSNIQGSAVGAFNFAGVPSTYQANQRINDFGTLRVRFGYMPNAALLVYGTGGLAYAQVEDSAVLMTPNTGGGVGGGPGFKCPTATVACFAGNTTRGVFGWTLGGGLEYGFTRNLSVKAEYAFMSLNSGDQYNVTSQYLAPGVGIASFTAGYSRFDLNIVRAGLNWRM
jgi:outer membrane immunogenic protein